jgi:hypothetical protein
MGLSVVHNAVQDAARRVGGNSLFTRDEEHQTDVLSNPSWQQADHAATAAALALGAPAFLGGPGVAAAAHRWTTVIGHP